MDAHVKGGTNAGFRNPFQGRALPWQCRCELRYSCDACDDYSSVGDCTCGDVIRKTHPGYLKRCPDCHQARPE